MTLTSLQKIITNILIIIKKHNFFLIWDNYLNLILIFIKNIILYYNIKIENKNRLNF